MPADHCFGCDEDERLLPTGPDSPSNYPEEPLEGPKARPRMAPFQHDKLLAQGQVFEEKASMHAKMANSRSKPEPEESKHGQQLCQNAGETMAAMLFQSRPEFRRTTGASTERVCRSM